MQTSQIAGAASSGQRAQPRSSLDRRAGVPPASNSAPTLAGPGPPVKIVESVGQGDQSSDNEFDTLDEQEWSK